MRWLHTSSLALSLSLALSACASATGPEKKEDLGIGPFIEDGSLVGDGGNDDLSVDVPDGYISFDLGGPKADIAAGPTSGQVDPTFGIPFYSMAGNGEDAFAVLEQADGRIVVGGWFANSAGMGIARYLDTGALDTSFNGKGWIQINPSGNPDAKANGMVIQPDQKVVGAGYGRMSITNPALARLVVAGTLDTTFNGTGTVLTPVATTGWAETKAIARQADGKLVVAAYFQEGSAKSSIVVMRFTDTGVLDSTFGTAGKVSIVVGAGNADPKSVVMQADGKILVAGRSNDGTHNQVLVMRLETNGTFDSSFGTGGKMMATFGAGDCDALGMALQSNGKIIVVGGALDGTRSTFLTARFLQSGTIDASFGTGGSTFTKITGATGETARAVTVQWDDKPVIVGDAYMSNSNAAVVRLTANGTPDFTFNATGQMVITKMWRDATAAAVAIQASGRILVAGGAFPVAPDPLVSKRYFVTRLIP